MESSNAGFVRVSSQLAVTKNNLRTTTLMDPFLPRPLLADVLDEIGPLPRESLFLGKAEDGLPVLLNYQDPTPGPILIFGDPHSGKTDFLRVIAQFAISTYTPADVQFAVMTEQPEEWSERLAGSRHCIGVFASHSSDARRLVQSLAAWISISKRQRQAVLLFIDGLQQILPWDLATLACLQRVFTDGPPGQVWPFVTLTPLNALELDAWLRFFQFRIFAKPLVNQDSDLAGEGSFVNPSLSVNAPWFSFEEDQRWMSFWIPAPGY